MTVIDIEDYKPHLTICTGKTVYVIPLGLVENWTKELTELPESEILKTIIAEWLSCVKKGYVRMALNYDKYS